MFKKIIFWLLRIYQSWFSPDQGFFRSRFGICRFRPTCSQYARQTIEKFGIFRGSWLAIKRLSRCHPLNDGGWDPAPLKESAINN